MTPSAVNVENLGKRYRITHGAATYRTLREALMHLAKAPIRRLRTGSGESQREDFWALKDISVQIQAGEVVAVIGRNGAGKSTLLKILSRITKPTTGRATLRGRVGSLLEVGTGFHPELTGRENIYLNGAILGMSRREISAKFDEIVDFAEISQFLDTPVKRYSSGMYVRLAFAVAAHLEPEILLVDEVLAVGDTAFQRKCLGKMGQVARQGRTILFVSHNMAAVARLCQWALWLDRGQVRAQGDVQDVVAQYLASGAQQAGEVTFPKGSSTAPGSDYVQLRGVRIRKDAGEISSLLDVRLPFVIEVDYEILKPVKNLRVGLNIMTSDGISLLGSLDVDTTEALSRSPGTYRSGCHIPAGLLRPGHYYVSVGSDIPLHSTHFSLDSALGFHIAATDGFPRDGKSGFIHMNFPWRIQRLADG